DADSLRREYRRGMEQRTVELAAVETVADADAVRQAGGDQPHRSAQTASGESFHQGLPCIWPRHGSVIDAARGHAKGHQPSWMIRAKPPQHHPEATEQPGRALVELQCLALPSIGRLPGRKQGSIVVYRTYDRLAVEQLDLFVLPVIDDITGGTD